MPEQFIKLCTSGLCNPLDLNVLILDYKPVPSPATDQTETFQKLQIPPVSGTGKNSK